jgi:hydroxymethylpyrimidine pyrophosphatase-like HAD family hydrolase
MNTGQSFMSIGAIILLSLASLSFNSAVLQNTTLETENKVYLTAFSLADDLIEEIKQKAFDEKTIDFQAINVNQLTYPPNRESGEVWPYFDDIDDYNNYNKPVSLPHAEGYSVSCIVNYSTANGDDISVRSFYKKVTIKVTSDYMSSPLYLKYVFSLHSKN